MEGVDGEEVECEGGGGWVCIAIQRSRLTGGVTAGRVLCSFRHEA